MHTIITISRQLGSRGSYIATEAANKLTARYVDREVLRRAAENAGYSDESLLALLEQEEQLPILARDIVTHILAQPLVPAVASATIRENYAFDDQVHTLINQHAMDYTEAIARATEVRDKTISSPRYAQLVRHIFETLAEQGDMIFVGRGGQVILKAISSAIHVRIFAPMDVRMWSLQQRLGISEKQAERDIANSDRQRAQYLQRFFGYCWDDPELYDLCINAGRISSHAASELILNLVQHKSRQLGMLGL